MALVTQSPLNPDVSRLQHGLSHGADDGYSSKASSLPKGFPIALSTSLAWNGLGLTDEGLYVYFLTKDEVLEIEAALAAFKALGLDGDLVNHETFHLPTLQPVLRSLCNEVHSGKGFFLLRGLDPERYSLEDGMVIFLGIQSYIAEQRARQDDKGNMIVHIISDSSTASSPARNLHSRHSTKSIAFHTEEIGDIIAWQTRNTAARGGSCVISSAYTVYNILATIRPDIIHTLSQPDWPFALPHFHRRPILFHHDSHFIFNFCRAALLGSAAHPRPSHMPLVTAVQRDALDVFEAVARSVELKIATKAGDLHFVNNLAVVHRRDEFVDDDDDDDDEARDGAAHGAAGGDGQVLGKEKKKRHLVRMRIRNAEQGWELPPVLRKEWEAMFGEEGGRVWHLDPMPEGFFPLRKYLL